MVVTGVKEMVVVNGRNRNGDVKVTVVVVMAEV